MPARIRVVPALHAKAAADLAGNDPQLRFRDMEDAARQVGARRVRALRPDRKGKVPKPIVPLADTAARLHSRGDNGVEDELHATDMVGLGETRRDGALVTQGEGETLVAAGFCPELRRVE
jgi:hypothetical protein